MDAFILLTIICFFARSDATRCLECNNIPYPHECAKVRTCSDNEQCYIQQVVTTSGNIVFNIGCMSDTQCSAATQSMLIGKRSPNITQRSSSDISTCIECCQGEFCNYKGCGTHPPPLGQRGPYCFNCDGVLDPKKCSEIAICEVNEQCLLYSPPELSGLPETVYRGRCENNAACTVLPTVFTNYQCPPNCCSDDFCNDGCGPVSNNTLTTTASQPTTVQIPTKPIVVTATQPPVVTTTHGAVQGNQDSCKKDHYFDDLTGLCIFIDETRLLSQTDAERACEQIGDQLVTIDTHEKTVFIENMILRHSGLPDVDDRKYFIGAYDIHRNGGFYWPNGNKMFYTNWGGHDEVEKTQQPDGKHVHYQQRCVIIYGHDHYEWHDDVCTNKAHFICEDRSFLKQSSHNVHHTDPPTHIPNPTQPSTAFHCDAHHGYMLMKSGHENLCVHIHSDHATWDKARQTCKDEGGDLVILDNHEKSTLVRDEVEKSHYSAQSGYWIGARDFQQKDQFSWVNGHTVSHGDWHPGQPNHFDGGNIQDCACLWSSSEKYQWHDDYCAKPLGFICEKR